MKVGNVLYIVLVRPRGYVADNARLDNPYEQIFKDYRDSNGRVYEPQAELSDSALIYAERAQCLFDQIADFFVNPIGSEINSEEYESEEDGLDSVLDSGMGVTKKVDMSYDGLYVFVATFFDEEFWKRFCKMISTEPFDMPVELFMHQTSYEDYEPFNEKVMFTKSPNAKMEKIDDDIAPFLPRKSNEDKN